MFCHALATGEEVDIEPFSWAVSILALSYVAVPLLFFISRNSIHVIGYNLYSRYKSNTNIEKKSEDCCNEISIHQANSISEEKVQMGKRRHVFIKQQNNGNLRIGHSIWSNLA